jgi:hypothetical protein
MVIGLCIYILLFNKYTVLKSRRCGIMKQLKLTLQSLTEYGSTSSRPASIIFQIKKHAL